MKSDLDALMGARQLAAIIVACDHHFSAPLAYLTGGVEITNGLVMKKRGDLPVIFANPMETEEAAKSGLRVYSFTDVGWPQMLIDAEGDRVKAEIVFWGKCLEMVGVDSGKIGIYGVSELNVILELVRHLEATYPQYQFVGELGMTLFAEAATTKDADELARLKSVAERTNAVLEATWAYIAACRTDGTTVIKADGAPLTIGDVKRFVRRELLDRDLEDTGMIFAQGRDAGFPHSRGEAGEALRLGEAIVFDLFPHEIGGGYYHDVTRTWCIGHAPQPVQAAYNDVMTAFDIATEVFRAGMPSKAPQEAVLDYLESKGHPTQRSHPGSNEGYVHSLGHGIGLNIHERPGMSHLSTDTLQVGNVITIEPGVYYPERGFGVRVEDSFYVDENGGLVALTNFRKDLILPLTP
jgi:Xaa-Pro aminopeptidase